MSMRRQRINSLSTGTAAHCSRGRPGYSIGVHPKNSTGVPWALNAALPEALPLSPVASDGSRAGGRNSQYTKSLLRACPQPQPRHSSDHGLNWKKT